ncbi:TPA: hypothetical protein ACOB67_000657 [Pseudomonas aeruginosa]|uniref:hypothetical protein n=1 Tax=Pseudomonas aeruginosa TaxID=287 RepID=UPI00208EC40C
MSSTQHQLIEQCATRLRGIVEALDNIHDNTPHRWLTDLDDVHSSAESLLALIKDQAPARSEASFEEWLANELEGEDGQPVPAAVCDIALARRAFNHWPKLEQPAKVGGVRFSAGVSSRLVVEAAQRLYEFESTPEKEAERIDPEQESVEQAGGDERVIGWRERILAAHPNSDPGFWTDALLVEHMAAEIADLRAALAQPSPTLPPFAEKVLAKLRRFNDCAGDFESGGVDIGRHWLDLLTQLGLLNRAQRSPALWEISQQGDDLLEGQAAQAGQVPQAWLDVQAERKRQVEAEGWTPEHDDEHSHGQMARAAACYALAGSSAPNDGTAALLVSLAWPWDEQWWKPTTTRRDLVKACALGLAEIERLDRAGISQSPQPGATTASS